MDPEPSATPPPVQTAELVPGEPLATVAGVPLEPGERVIAYVAANHKTAKIVHIVIGVVLVPLLFGIVLIVYGVLYDRWHLRFAAVTNRRVIMQKGDGPARWLRREEIVDVRSRREAGGGGGIYGAAAALDQVAQNMRASKRSNLDPGYWANTEAVIVEGKSGTLTIGGGIHAAPLGLTIAKTVDDAAHADALPTLNHPV